MMRWIFVSVWIGGLVSAVLAVAAVPERNASGIVNIQQLSPNAVDQTRLEREAERF
ncbi:hypothetical protein [Georhizobium profundi]|jgi:hypothetical protein|uniref:hypothetical protein n=1 Tax=Georhizobium profundi TaxID=2341112 RepID=UPI0013DF8DA1|nr:hypothetical protein [Georhizobium profundi]